MGTERKVVFFDEYEQNIMIRALNDLRTKQLELEKTTEPVDELIEKVVNAKRKTLWVGERSYDEGR